MFLLPVMLMLLSGGLTEVVDNFLNKCPQYFMNKIPQTGLRGDRYKQICQTLDDKQYYATLYDTYNKIPVYSAYRYIGKDLCKRPSMWYIEPQLDGGADKNMGPKGNLALNKQSSNEDYTNSGYEKGHLAPVCHANSQEFVKATFTLTNAAPQISSFNKKWYWYVESIMLKTVNNNCTQNTAHILTGVVPSAGNGTIIIKNRVNVPSHFWTAFCCIDLKTNKFISGGITGVNSVQDQTLRQFTVADLEKELKNLYMVESFSLFDDECKKLPIFL